MATPQAAKGPQYEDKILLVLTLIIGAIVGLVVVVFIVVTENLGGRLYPPGSPAWRRVLIPVAGALITAFPLYRYFPSARGSGIPQAKVALFLENGYISFRTVLAKFGLCSVSLASGIALGREGPSVYVGAGIASTLGRRLRLSTASIKALVPVGAAAAIGAAFNTPISAVLFALEEVMGDMHAPVLGSVVLGSATSWIVLHLFLGDEPLFHVPAYRLVHPVEFVFYAALGIIGGLVSVAFVKLLLWQRLQFRRVPSRVQWMMPAVGGLTVGLLGWWYPEVLGVGYAFVGKALNGEIALGAMALLVLLKLVATATCYSSGNAGGIFGPSLFIGAMAGGAFGGIAHLALPDYTGSVGTYALVGMGATFAGIIRVPLTSVIMIFEITRDYSIIVPLMISNLLSYFISSRLQELPIYEALQHQDGIHLPSGNRARESLLTVGHAFQRAATVLAGSERIAHALGSVDRERGAWPVVAAGEFVGMATLDDLEQATAEGRGEARVAEVARFDGAEPVFEDDPLDAAMRRLADGRVKALPVMSRMNSRELRGTISLSDALSAYSLTGDGHSAEAPAPTVSSSRLLVGAAAVVIGFVVLGGFLSYFYRAERVRKAEQAYQAGNALFGEGRVSEAIEQYRYALSISHKPDDRLALGIALVKAGSSDEARLYLDEVLREIPNSGPANLAMAQVLAAQGRVDDAVQRYRRAVLGAWGVGRAAEQRFEARRELVQLLAKAGRAPQARAELLAAVADLPADPAPEKQAGQMLLELGLAREARDLYGRLLQKGPPDAAEYDGLGEASMAIHDYRSAEEAFRNALSIDRSDQAAARGAGLAAEVVALDPSERGIGSRERFRRTEELLRGVIGPCGAAGDEATQAAQAALARKRPPSSYSDAADANIALAERISKRPGCAPDEVLRLVLAKAGS
jgi:CIC family chloride channel protein